jgi:quinol monooxygenase YgiN
MPVTIVFWTRTRPGRAEELVAVMGAMMDVPAAGRSRSLLLQAVDDPARFLYVADWETRAAFDASVRRATISLAPLLAADEPPVEAREVAAHEDAGRTAEAVGCLTIDAPATACRAIERWLADALRALRTRAPELVAWRALREQGQPCRLLLLHRWESEEAMQAFLAGRDAAALSTHVEAFEATCARFLGRARAEHQPRPPARDNP